MATDGASFWPRLAAAGVHALTASGAVIAFAALFAAVDGASRQMWLLLGAAFVVDGIDGPLARALDVKRLWPHIDGALLDLIVDYLTYVLVPAVFLYRSALVPPAWAGGLTALILLVSLYTFANRNMKDADHFFVGFPAAWNAVVFLLYAFEPAPWINVLCILALAVLTFVPVRVVHPLRVRAWRGVTLGVVLLWALSALAVVLSEGGKPDWALAALGLASAYFLGLSLWRTFAGATPAPRR